MCGKHTYISRLPQAYTAIAVVGTIQWIDDLNVHPNQKSEIGKATLPSIARYKCSSGAIGWPGASSENFFLICRLFRARSAKIIVSTASEYPIAKLIKTRPWEVISKS